MSFPTFDSFYTPLLFRFYSIPASNLNSSNYLAHYNNWLTPKHTPPAATVDDAFMRGTTFEASATNRQRVATLLCLYSDIDDIFRDCVKYPVNVEWTQHYIRTGRPRNERFYYENNIDYIFYACRGYGRPRKISIEKFFEDVARYQKQFGEDVEI